MKQRTTAACVLVGAAVIFSSGARAADPPRIDGLGKDQKTFMDWQRLMLKRRTQPTEQMKRIFYHKITVPPPAPPGPASRGRLDKIKYHPDYDFANMDRMGLFPGLPVLGVGSGDPTVTVSLKAQAGVLSLSLLEQDVSLLAIGPDSNGAFGDMKTSMKAGLLQAPLPHGGEVEAAWTYQMTANRVESEGPSVKLGGSYGLFSGGIQVKGSGEAGEVEVSGAVGRELVPKEYSRLGKLTLAVEGTVSMPMVIEDVQWTSKHGVSQLASRAAAKITRMMHSDTDCQYCKRQGQVTCRQCYNRRTITCAKCKGTGKVDCPGCRNGRVSCPTTQACGRCQGYGRIPCTNCRRTGTVTVQRKYYRQETRSWKELVRVGFDSNGNPIHKMRWRTKTVNVPYWWPESVLCKSCGGVGYHGRCGNCSGDGRVTCRICQGRGWYTHRRCGGTGEIPCPTCEGSGRILCPTCRGRKIVCPLCNGRKRIGPGS